MLATEQRMSSVRSCEVATRIWFSDHSYESQSRGFLKLNEIIPTKTGRQVVQPRDKAVTAVWRTISNRSHWCDAVADNRKVARQVARTVLCND